MEIKEGWKTTEFWITIATSTISLLVIVGVLTTEQAALWHEAVLLIIAAIAATITPREYVIGRSALKKAVAEQEK